LKCPFCETEISKEKLTLARERLAETIVKRKGRPEQKEAVKIVLFYYERLLGGMGKRVMLDARVFAVMEMLRVFTAHQLGEAIEGYRLAIKTKGSYWYKHKAIEVEKFMNTKRVDQFIVYWDENKWKEREKKSQRRTNCIACQASGPVDEEGLCAHCREARDNPPTKETMRALDEKLKRFTQAFKWKEDGSRKAAKAQRENKNEEGI